MGPTMRFSAVLAMVSKRQYLAACVVIWLTALPSANMLTDSQDVYALNQLYKSLTSPFLNGWNGAGGDPCTEKWEGVACAGPNVTLLNLTGLGLTGGLGSALQNLTALIVLDLSNNLLSNALPLQLPPHVQIIDLSINQFTGNLPSALAELSNLANLNLSSNLLSGSLLDMFAPLPGLSSLDLSSNDFVGPLPSSFVTLTNLNYLYLQDNNFSGSLNVLANLPLTDLDVSNNSFTGWIPSEFKRFPSSKFAGNSFNAFPAPPPPPPLSVAPDSPPVLIAHSVPDEKTQHSHQQTKSIKSYFTAGRLTGMAVAFLLTVAVAVLVICFFTLKKQSKVKNEKYDIEGSWHGTLVSSFKGDQKQSYVRAYNQREEVEELEPAIKSSPKINTAPEFAALKPPPAPFEIMNHHKNKNVPRSVQMIRQNHAIAAYAYTIADLQSATECFSENSFIGGGSLGRVYKGQLPNQKCVAIKKLDCSINQMEEKDFLELLSKISHLHHENIVGLEGYCLDYGQRLLVYNFVSNGNVHEHLHSNLMNKMRLDWKARVKIALGAARALEYLHENCKPPIFHRNLTSNNILLDADWTPHLSDCGLANYLKNEQASAEFLGYSAPEVTSSGLYSTESDVYSFGVIMLELLTGRRALDSSRPRSEHSLVRWALPQLCDIDAIGKMLDPAIEESHSKKCMSRFADIISRCVQAEAQFRPLIGQVVQDLEQLQDM